MLVLAAGIVRRPRLLRVIIIIIIIITAAIGGVAERTSGRASSVALSAGRSYAPA